MDWFITWFNPIVTLFAHLVLAGFTVVLAIATVKLHRSTERYADISKGLLITDELSYLERLYGNIRPEDTGLSDAEKEAVMGIPKGEMPPLEKQKQFHGKWVRFYGGLLRQMADRMDKEFPQGDTE